jgi:hypothetical protein
MEFVDFITKKASQCGWKISKIFSDSMVMLTFSTEMDDENVYIKPCGKNSDGNTILEFSSAGIPLPDNIADSALMAITLLERNGEMIFGHWGIETIGDQKCFTVFSTLVANTMDNDEFAAAVKAIVNERVRIAKVLQKHAVSF